MNPAPNHARGSVAAYWGIVVFDGTGIFAGKLVMRIRVVIMKSNDPLTLQAALEIRRSHRLMPKAQTEAKHLLGMQRRRSLNCMTLLSRYRDLRMLHWVQDMLAAAKRRLATPTITQDHTLTDPSDVRGNWGTVQVPVPQAPCRYATIKQGD